jgi:hypothetical protein
MIGDRTVEIVFENCQGMIFDRDDIMVDLRNITKRVSSCRTNGLEEYYYVGDTRLHIPLDAVPLSVPSSYDNDDADSLDRLYQYDDIVGIIFHDNHSNVKNDITDTTFYVDYSDDDCGNNDYQHMEENVNSIDIIINRNYDEREIE